MGTLPCGLVQRGNLSPDGANESPFVFNTFDIMLGEPAQPATSQS